MKKLFACTLTAMCFMAESAWAGSLDSPAPPTDGASAMPTVNGVYNLLTTGAGGMARAGAFSEPSATPASSTHTLTEVLNAAPAADNANGAAPDDVREGKTYWELRTGTGPGINSNWGVHAGTNSDLRIDNRWGQPAVTSGSNYPAPVPKTGQTSSYAGGDDGALKPGAAWPNPRFTDNNNGTVTDNLTGLIWLQDANCAGAATWANALTWSNNLANTNNTCGLSDGSVAGSWRLPQAVELDSLLDVKYSGPALANTAGTAQWTSGSPFKGVQSSNYWSSSTSIASQTKAWSVNLSDGSVSINLKTSSSYVWPVRGGQ